MQIFTNRHVIDCDYSDLKCYQRLSEKIQVRTQDGKMHNVARVLYAPHGLDLAVLELNIDSNENYDSVYVRKEGLQLGEEVTAVGYPAFNDKIHIFKVVNKKIGLSVENPEKVKVTSEIKLQKKIERNKTLKSLFVNYK